MKAYLEIEMPRCCNKCPMLVYEGYGIEACRVLHAIEDSEILKPWKNRRKDCPLVPIQPHGELIDRGALKDVQQAAADFFKGSSDYGEICRYDEAINAVANIVNATTIIPASEGE